MDNAKEDRTNFKELWRRIDMILFAYAVLVAALLVVVFRAV